MLKHGGDNLISALKQLFNDIIHPSGVPPDSWKTLLITVLYKDGDPQEPSNYRPIAGVKLLYKLFARLILSRIKGTLESRQPVDQAGFRAGFSTEDHIFTLCQLEEKCREWRKDLWLLFIDYRKAFDTVEHPSLWTALQSQGLAPCYIHLLQKLYQKTSGRVVLDCISKEFAIGRGVKQGDPMSPTLFNSVLEDVFQELAKKWVIDCRGVDVGSLRGDRLTNLRFADDVVLIASSLSEARRMLEDLVMAARSRGLEIHPKKTKVMSNCVERKGYNSRKDIEVAGQKVEVLTYGKHLKYLGRFVCLGNLMEAEIENRIVTGWKRFYTFRDILCNKAYPLRKRMKFFDTVITPSVLYASGSWTMTADLESRLRKTQRRMLRTIFQKGRKRQQVDEGTKSSSSLDELQLAPEQDDSLEPWVEFMKRVTREIEEQMDNFKSEDWVRLQRRRKFTWAGHVARRCDDRWSTTLLSWQPEGGRRQGGKGRCRRQARPSRRWEEALCEFFRGHDFDEDVGWKLLAHSREDWQGLIEDFVTA